MRFPAAAACRQTGSRKKQNAPAALPPTDNPAKRPLLRSFSFCCDPVLTVRAVNLLAEAPPTDGKGVIRFLPVFGRKTGQIREKRRNFRFIVDFWKKVYYDSIPRSGSAGQGAGGRSGEVASRFRDAKKRVLFDFSEKVCYDRVPLRPFFRRAAGRTRTGRKRGTDTYRIRYVTDGMMEA